MEEFLIASRSQSSKNHKKLKLYQFRRRSGVERPFVTWELVGKLINCKMVAIPAGIRLSDAPVRGCPLTGKPSRDRAGFARLAADLL